MKFNQLIVAGITSSVMAAPSMTADSMPAVNDTSLLVGNETDVPVHIAQYRAASHHFDVPSGYSGRYDSRHRYYEEESDFEDERTDRGWSLPSSSSHLNNRWESWQYDAEYDSERGWENNDRFYRQEMTSRFLLECQCDEREYRHLHKTEIQALPDGHLGIGFDEDVAVPLFAQIGRESNHLFHSAINKPFAVLGGQNSLHTVSSFRVASRPWTIKDHVLYLSHSSSAVACPVERGSEQYTVHWGEPFLCKGGVPIHIVVREAEEREREVWGPAYVRDDRDCDY